MASIEKRTRAGQTRWYAPDRDPAGRQRTKTFGRKLGGDRFLITTEAPKLTGSYVDVRAAARLCADVAEEHWRAYAHLLADDTTRPRKRSVLDHHILPVLGRYPIGAIEPITVAAAVATCLQTLAPGNRRAGPAPGPTDLGRRAGRRVDREQPRQGRQGAHRSAATRRALV